VEGKANEHKVLVGKVEGKKLLGRLRQITGKNIKINIREIGWDDMNSIPLIRISTNSGLLCPR
jgi:hypothetical protein